MADDETDNKLHIAVFPWLAFGHMIPFLELSNLLAQNGLSISYISTPRNFNRLPQIPPHLSHLSNQGLIARVFAEKEVGVEIPRDEEDGGFLRGDVAATVRTVVAEDKEKVFENREIHGRCFAEFVRFLQDHRRNKALGVTLVN
ncbi:UDP-glycosyltransferase 91A1 [Linum grandiflorum]